MFLPGESQGRGSLVGCRLWGRTELDTTENKGSGGDGIPAELFQIPKYDAEKVLHSIGQQIWKTQQRSQENVQTTTQLHSPHTPVK